MGYTTDFSGSFELNKPLSPKMKEFLTKFNNSRRMARKQPAKYGIQGEFFVDGSGMMGQGEDKDILNHNQPPETQPGLWCQWTPNQDGTAIEWDGGEKFYNYNEWLLYIIHKFLAPNGYILNGQITWQGEETGDVGEIIVENNRIFIEPYREERYELTLESVVREEYVAGKGFMKTKSFIRPDVVLLFDEKEKTVKSTPKKATGSKKKSVTIKIEGLKNDLNERQMKSLMKVVKQYTEGLVDKNKSEYTLKHKQTELKGK